ncbi:MAG: DUF6790 family protein [Verrucomicrobiae bacterium]
MALALHLAEIAIATLGIFFGFFHLATDPVKAFALVTGACVGVVGILAFVRHVVFHRSDALRLGWQADRPDWQFEVGFANLAFGVMGCIVALWKPVFLAFFVVLLGYSVYLAQAAVLHLYRYLAGPDRSSARLWHSVIATALFAAMLAGFAARALRG